MKNILIKILVFVNTLFCSVIAYITFIFVDIKEIKMNWNTTYFICALLVGLMVLSITITIKIIFDKTTEIKLTNFRNELKILLDAYTGEQLTTLSTEINTYNTVYKRKFQYLFDCIAAGKILDEPEYMTALEIDMFDKLFEKSMENAENLLEKFADKNP